MKIDYKNFWLDLQRQEQPAASGTTPVGTFTNGILTELPPPKSVTYPVTLTDLEGNTLTGTITIHVHSYREDA